MLCTSVRGLLAASLALLGLSCAHPSMAPPASGPTPEPPPVSVEPSSDLRFDIRAIDPHADPCKDFYDYACGGWRATHPIPPTETRWDRYAEMTALNKKRERSLVEQAARSAASPAERRVGAYYAACLDQQGIEARGLAPIRELLAEIDAIKTGRDAVEVIAELQAHEIDPLFDPYPVTDPHDARQMVMSLEPGSLGLPDPGDYTKSDEASVALRVRYIGHLSRLFRLLGESDAAATLSASRVLVLETSLAKKALSAVETRHRDAQDHPMTLAELGARFPAIDWRAYFVKLGAPSVDRVNVAQPAWLDAVNDLLESADQAPVRDTLRMLAVSWAAALLPGAIEEEVFDFDHRILSGAREMEPRWRRCLRLVDRDVGDDVGRLFVAKYFSNDARVRVRKMVDQLKAAYRSDIRSSSWLGASARATAEKKLDKILVVIGASNRPHSFDGLRIEPDDPFGNAWRAEALFMAEELVDLGKPTDREKFFHALPQKTDAFGSKPMNANGFTAGFLQPPVFDPGMDDAVNFGALGSVIGHELSHRFDDEGRRYDPEGNLHPWWSDQDVARFTERAECFVDEYSAFHTEDGTPLDGKLTLGENIADNGGIRLSYAALRPSESGPRIDGFTPAQRFFLAWGQIRCENVTPERARLQARTDPHAPGRWRVDGVVSNLPEFARAFSCPAGAPMAPAKRCAVW